MYKNGWDSITKKGEDYNPSSYLEVEDHALNENNDAIPVDANKKDSEKQQNEPLSA